MSVTFGRRHRALSVCMLLMSTSLPARAAGTGAGFSATETALVFTATLTLLIIAALFLVLVMPPEHRRALTEFARQMRRVAFRGAEGQVSEFDHDFDGIRELENRIPPWFSTLFIGTVIFGVVYMMDYHVLGTSNLMADEYNDEMAAAELARRVRIANEGSIDENALVALDGEEPLQRGEVEFKKFCVSCHGTNGEGLVGPNLTDDYWIHGSGIKNVYTTIKLGVPAKGMISWQLVFTPMQMQEIASYVLSLRGTNPPNAKKPEGLLVAERDTTTVAARTGPAVQP